MFCIREGCHVLYPRMLLCSVSAKSAMFCIREGFHVLYPRMLPCSVSAKIAMFYIRKGFHLLYPLGLCSVSAIGVPFRERELEASDWKIIFVSFFHFHHCVPACARKRQEDMVKRNVDS